MQRFVLFTTLSSLLLNTIACERSQAPTPTPVAGVNAKPDNGAAQPDAAAGGHGHAVAVVELGETTVDGLKVKASRDHGEIKPGGDAPIDIWINGGLGEAAAVRFWIGGEDAKGSIKAKAAVEAGHWHTHTEVPDPLPADSKLWVAIERKDGKKSVVSFDLK